MWGGVGKHRAGSLGRKMLRVARSGGTARTVPPDFTLHCLSLGKPQSCWNWCVCPTYQEYVTTLGPGYPLTNLHLIFVKWKRWAWTFQRNPGRKSVSLSPSDPYLNPSPSEPNHPRIHKIPLGATVGVWKPTLPASRGQRYSICQPTWTFSPHCGSLGGLWWIQKGIATETKSLTLSQESCLKLA